MLPSPPPSACKYAKMCLPPSSPVGFQTTVIPAIPFAVASLIASVSIAALLTLFFILRRIRAEDAAAGGHFGASGNSGTGDGEVDRHARSAGTAGLDESTIAGIATLEYKADEALTGVSPPECAVCLSEFCHGEMLRFLPRCVHAFHPACIDAWLRFHINCPLCRALVVAPSAPT